VETRLGLLVRAENSNMLDPDEIAAVAEGLEIIDVAYWVDAD